MGQLDYDMENGDWFYDLDITTAMLQGYFETWLIWSCNNKKEQLVLIFVGC